MGSHSAPALRARQSLDGLSVGDGFGERFFGDPHLIRQAIAARRLPPGPWMTTDDTEMAVALVEVLEEHNTFTQVSCARRLVKRYQRDPGRGYGAGAHGLLGAVGGGLPWDLG